MIFKKGCLIKAFKDKEVDLIIHQCNCFKTWGAGIAKQLKKDFPNAYIADLNSTLTPSQRLGNFTTDGTIYNAYGQYNYGRGHKTIYELLEKSLILIESNIPDNIVVGIPKIGCGLAGGDWEVVSKIINRVFRNNPIKVYEL